MPLIEDTLKEISSGSEEVPGTDPPDRTGIHCYYGFWVCADEAGSFV